MSRTSTPLGEGVSQKQTHADGGAAVPKQGGWRVYIPQIIGPHPPNNYKMQTPDIFNLPNMLNGDHLVLRT